MAEATLSAYKPLPREDKKIDVESNSKVPKVPEVPPKVQGPTQQPPNLPQAVKDNKMEKKKKKKNHKEIISSILFIFFYNAHACMHMYLKPHVSVSR